MADYKIVPGAQVTLAERELIKSLSEQSCRRFNYPVFVNIGIMWGATMWCLRAGCDKATLYGVDIVPDKWKITEKDGLHAYYITGDSTKVHANFNSEINLLLIDGDHHYDTVKADIAGWTPKVTVGGVVIFHDYRPTPHNLKQFPELEGVKRAVNEWKQSVGSKWEKEGMASSAIVFRKIL